MNLPTRAAVGLAFSLVLGASFSGGGAEAQARWRVLYSGALPVSPPSATAQERVLLGRAAARRAAEDCTAGERLSTAQLIGRAPGPFLRAGTQETALVYQTCELFMGDTLGLLITRAGQPVLHMSFKGSAINEVYSVLDINRDGLRELAMLENFADAGSGEAWVNVWDFRRVAAGGLPSTPYRFLTVNNRCELDSPGRSGSLRHYTIWVRPGEAPTFRADESGANGCDDQPLTRLRTSIKPLLPAFPAPSPTRLPLP